MFGLFKKKTKKEKLLVKYEQLLRESYEFSSINRRKSDQKNAEAAEIMEKILLLD